MWTWFFDFCFILYHRNSPSPDSDIALLVLDHPIKFSDVRDYAYVEPKQIRPICIPKRGEWIEPAGKKGIVAGWGKMPDPNNTVSKCMYLFCLHPQQENDIIFIFW